MCVDFLISSWRNGLNLIGSWRNGLNITSLWRNGLNLMSSGPPHPKGRAHTCLNNRKKSDKNVFTTFTFRFQQYDHKITNFSIKSYLENVQMFWFWSTNQNKLTKIAFFVFLPILMSCQFSFFGKKKCQSTLFWQKICQNHLVVGRQNPTQTYQLQHKIIPRECAEIFYKVNKPKQADQNRIFRAFANFDVVLTLIFWQKKNDNPLFFGEKIAKATGSLVDKIQGFANKFFVFYQEMLIYYFWKKHCQNHRFVDRQNPKFYQKYFRFLAKNFQSILFLAKNC